MEYAKEKWNTKCPNCNKITKRGYQHCNSKCRSSYLWKLSVENLLLTKYDKTPNARIAKKYLVEKGRGSCFICKFDTWMGKPMPLVLDHINGHHEDNRLENLRVICNNCDSLLDTYKSKNIGNGRKNRYPQKQKREIKKQKYCIDCNSEVTNTSTRCSKCFSLTTRKTERPSKEELHRLVWMMPTTKVGEKFGVSDTSVTK